MHEDIISYLLIAVEKQSSHLDVILTYQHSLSQFLQICILLLKMKKQNNSLSFCAFWQNVRIVQSRKNLLELHCPARQSHHKCLCNVAGPIEMCWHIKYSVDFEDLV